MPCPQSIPERFYRDSYPSSEVPAGVAQMNMIDEANLVSEPISLLLFQPPAIAECRVGSLHWQIS